MRVCVCVRVCVSLRVCVCVYECESNEFSHIINIYNFDPYNVLLSIYTNIAVLLMTRDTFIN